uniref:Ovule protein n=1 Tax=Parascaris univalens TaxID=6257 RepID=A0A915BXE2_PARUN
ILHDTLRRLVTSLPVSQMTIQPSRSSCFLHIPKSSKCIHFHFLQNLSRTHSLSRELILNIPCTWQSTKSEDGRLSLMTFAYKYPTGISSRLLHCLATLF